ncbi:MAG: methionine adenosyltransferase [Oscillospiraceae bacterium]|nr:methionine adenosyltransferase [Oscillospiraceae bacterium]
MMKTFFSSESVTEGHPDKICDQISDAVLDELIRQDKNAHVACETFTSTGMVFVMGEVSAEAYADVEGIARKVVRDIGYNNGKLGFDADAISVITSLHAQSPDIAMGVNNALESRGGSVADTGAGDQGTMFGYACDETETYQDSPLANKGIYMPLPIYYAHALSRRLAKVRKDGTVPFLRPDGKTLVSIEYNDGKPTRVDSLVISAQHEPDVTLDEIRESLIKNVVNEVLPPNLLDTKTKYFVNPTGRFVLGGPAADTGLTGRKIIVDTYGGAAHHGGGAFSGKDPTKVDRSAAYAARYLAKNAVAAGLAKRLEIQVSYAIGVANPVSVTCDSYGTGKLEDDVLAAKLVSLFDMRPRAIIEYFDLLRPIYFPTAAYGHFGRTDVDLPWERLDLASQM